MSMLPSIALATLVLGALAAAQNTLTGTWRGVTNAGASVQLELTATGTSLSGTLTRNDESTPISDGKISNSGFHFKATLNGQMDAYSGERTGDDLKVWLDRQGRQTAIVLKRATRNAPHR